MRVTLRMLRRGLPGQGRGLLLGMVFVVVTSGATLLQPWPLKMVLDSVIGHGKPPALVESALRLFNTLLPSGGDRTLVLLSLLCVALLLIEIIIAASHVVSAYLLNSVALKMVFKLRCELFDHVQRQSMAFHDSEAVGDSLYRITWDSYCIQAIFSEGVVPALTSGATLLGIGAVLLARDWRLLLAGLAVALPLVLLIRRLDRPMTEQSLRVHENESDVSTRVQETLVGIRAVQAFGRENFESDRFRDRANASLAANLRLTITQTISQAIVGLVLATGTAAVIWIGARGVLQGRLTAGDLVLLVAYVAMIFKPLETLAYTAAAVQNAAAGARRVLAVLERSPDIADALDAEPLPPETRAAIAFENVSFRYSRPGQPVLKDVDFAIAPGETIALVGPSGAGKTTLASLILRFYDPSAGRLTLNGRDLKSVRIKSLRDQIALVTQEPILFATTIRENIAYGRPNSTLEEIQAAARAAGAHSFIESLPEKYETRMAERGNTLSTGQKQRIAIARAFLKNAPILILDEPTSTLDTETESQLVHTLRDLVKGRTALIIAHRLSTIRGADRIIVLRDGRIDEIGTHEALLLKAGAYARLHGLQFREAAPARQEIFS